MVGVAGPSALYDNTGCPKVLGMKMVPEVGEEGCGRI